ncbi:hypothetical protein SERLA73DRAFT_189929 [Serpula lacrymans var. lacrymans S7.3]|uniref:PEHE domain-containing protein n=1 Tax=Serpula lacrymans var. lacrymans (strain S7.3) TaxID=936435 RepID=F8QET7_SERL3|nr:hypothetical protein SERLA73DRAFT_189929 [Serpula lacrymans var. lacrymans S7.3]
MADVTSAAIGSGVNTRQKRVLPSRSRRGGPGIGSCDVDLMILDAQKRKLENEPLIPENTQFLLTTNSGELKQPSTSASSGFEINNHAYQRYFDRPDVLKAYREQLIIQTPEFSLLSEDASVGGRFRPRSSEEESTDTSDAAYEKRHRKYETFEKRQRLREKEKLKHEHYKLKERIEQLRALDGNAFLALPASSFSAPPGVEEELPLSDLPGAHVNGAAVYNEGERRRKEMLDVAFTLDERYKTLLPSERKQTESKKDTKQCTPGESGIHPLQESVIGGRECAADTPPRSNKALKLTIKLPQPRQTPRLAHSPSNPGASPRLNSTTPYSFSHQKTLNQNVYETPVKPYSYNSSSIHTSRGLRYDTSDTQSIGSTRPSKRARRDMDIVDSSPASIRLKTHHPLKPHEEPCVLMLSAIRNSAAPMARKTQRNATAFGVKVPQEIELVRNFEIPQWIRRADTVFEDDDDQTMHYMYSSLGDTPPPD